MDWFKVVLEAGKAYQIDMKGEYGGGGTLGDPLLGNIRDSSGAEITDTGNDDIDTANDIYDSRTTFKPTTAGTYYLVATTADSSGTYTLSVREVPCALETGDIWCGVLTIGTTTLGGITSHGYVAFDNTGSLSPNSFLHEGTLTTFQKFAHNVPSSIAIEPDLELQTSPALPLGYNFGLQVGLQSFALAGGERAYFFTNLSGLNWSMSDGETVTLRLGETPSEHATLSGLTVNDGSSDLTLSPAFASDIVRPTRQRCRTPSTR